MDPVSEQNLKHWRGQVVDHNDVPIPNAVITIEASVPFPEIALITDDKGEFYVGLPNGQFRFTAQSIVGERGDTCIECETTKGDIVIQLLKDSQKKEKPA